MTAAALLLRGVVSRRRSGNAVFTLTVPMLVLAPGALLAVTGASGTGKSTLLDVAALARRPETAEALAVAGQDAAALWRAGRLEALAALRGACFGYILQTGGLIPFLTLRGNAQLAQDFAGRRDNARINALAEALEVAPLLDRFPDTLSVGQRQRAAILRALAHCPAVVVADEPTASVHPDMADTILTLLAEQARGAGAAVLLATHDAAAARRHGFSEAPLRPMAESSILAEPVAA